MTRSHALRSLLIDWRQLPGRAVDCKRAHATCFILSREAVGLVCCVKKFLVRMHSQETWAGRLRNQSYRRKPPAVVHAESIHTFALGVRICAHIHESVFCLSG